MRKEVAGNIRKKVQSCSMAICLSVAAMMMGSELTAQASPIVARGVGINGTLEEQDTSTKYTEQDIEEFYDDTVFVGDSIMLGFRNYAMKREEDGILSRLDFLAAGSFSANNSLWDADNENSVHPVYQGKRRQVWESISMMKSKRVFIMLGMNDLNITGLEGTCSNYQKLIENIKESSPDSEIYLMSMTYVLNGKEKGNLQNDTIREYNKLIEELAGENGWGYVNIADALADENGDLAAEYCSDEFVHQNSQAYDVWVTVLRDYAAKQLV